MTTKMRTKRIKLETKGEQQAAVKLRIAALNWSARILSKGKGEQLNEALMQAALDFAAARLAAVGALPPTELSVKADASS